MEKAIVCCLMLVVVFGSTLSVQSTTPQRLMPMIQFLDRNGNDLGDNAPHAEQHVLRVLRDILTERFTLQGVEPETIPQLVNDLIDSNSLVVYTTLDLDMQTVARQAVLNHAATFVQYNTQNAAVVVLDPVTGEIRAMIGNVDYNNAEIDGGLNMATLHREPATVLMPFVYAAAMENGWSSASVVWDTRTVIELADGTTFEPINFSRIFHGPTQLRDALASSYVAPTAQLLQAIGVDSLVDLMRRVGMSSVDPDDPIYDVRLSVGEGVALTLLELTSAYGTLAHYGQVTEPRIIGCVLDGDTNDILYEFESACPTGNHTASTYSQVILSTLVLDGRVAFAISDILADNNARAAAFGSNSPLNTSFGAAVKTGTSAAQADGWAIGYTPELAVGVWAGNSDGTPMQNASGLTVAGPIWHDTIEGIISGLAWPNEPFVPPAGISLRQVCRISSLRDPVVSCPQVRQEWGFDTPILVPDADGNMVEVIPEVEEPAPELLRYRLDEIFPGVIQTEVRLISEQEIATYLTNFPETIPPRYCLVPLSTVASTPGTQLQLFITPPEDTINASLAYEYALTNGFPILPRYSCEFNVFSSAANAPADPSLQTGDYEVNAGDPARTAAIFCRADGSIDVWAVIDGQGTPLFTATPELLAAVPSLPATNVLVMQSGDIRLYRLTSGEFQVNAPRGGDPNGYVFIWGGCGAP